MIHHNDCFCQQRAFWLVWGVQAEAQLRKIHVDLRKPESLLATESRQTQIQWNREIYPGADQLI